MLSLDFICQGESIENPNPYAISRDQWTRYNCPLTERGEEQARALTGSYDLLLVSPLRRAKDTLFFSQLQAKRIVYTPIVSEVYVDSCDEEDRASEEKHAVEDEGHIQNRMSQLISYLKQHQSKKIGVLTHPRFISWFILTHVPSSLHFSNTLPVAFGSITTVSIPS
jgi:broad specificity phosphatase PhoE